jgi:hypothetical protein
MMITNDIRISALRKKNPLIQELHASSTVGDTLKLLCAEYKLHDAETFVNFVGDIILGLYPKADFRKLLVGLVGVTPDVAIAIEQDLSALLFKIDGKPIMPPVPQDTRTPLEFRPAETGAPINPPTQTSSEGNVKPLTREEILRSITPKRTMASDIESVKGQGEGNKIP